MCGTHKVLYEAWRTFKWRLRLIIVLGGFLHWNQVVSAESTPAYTEYQVKALFLFNFTKYIDWPAAAFTHADSPIYIGIIGQNNIGSDLAIAIQGKTFNGRNIRILRLATEADWIKCQILFISASERKRQADILATLKALPILTVGETETFAQEGGMVNFTKKEGKVHLQVNLDSAQKAGLQISSRLLNVADVVRGKF